MTPQPISLPGQWTIAAGVLNLDTNCPPGAYPYQLAYATDRAGGPGFMYSTGTSWISTSIVPSSANPLIAGTASPGSASAYSREDHVHPSQAVPVASSTTPLVESGAGSVGTGTTFARADHVHPAAPGLALSSTTPAALGAAAVGTGTTAARSDHVHALPTGLLTQIYAGTIGETLIIGLSLGVRRYAVSVAGAAPGDKLAIMLSGAPSNGTIQDAYVSAAGTVSVGLLVPALSIGATIAVPIVLYKVT